MTAEPLQPTDCSEFRLRIHEYIDAEMGTADCDRVQAHLEDCAPCMSEYERDLVLKALIRRSCACEPAPTGLRTQILARLTTITIEIREDRRGR
ncbi:MAG: mycothiol system anti-sigma-R factor [Mobilicoccus sp.]|nr:mycothiol system anti-sigma-R factor [Mobilicoccus sp.]